MSAPKTESTAPDPALEALKKEHEETAIEKERRIREDDIHELVKIIRENLVARPGVIETTRIEFVKGSKLLDFLRKPALYEAEIPEKFMNETANEDGSRNKEKILALAEEILHTQEYFIRIEPLRNSKGEKKKGLFRPCMTENDALTMDPEGYYFWKYQPEFQMSPWMTAAVVIFALALVLFPLWPIQLKIGLWYFSMTMLVFMTGFIMVRFFLFLVSFTFGFEFWILPNLFDEEIPTLAESCMPIVSLTKVSSGQTVYRVVVFAIFAYFGWWAYSQPSEFDEMLAVQKQFVQDLYDGNLIADVSQFHKDNLDQFRRYPSIEDLMKEEREEQEAEAKEKDMKDYTKEEDEEDGSDEELLEQLLNNTEDGEEEEEE